jgi:PKD repeat protein
LSDARRARALQLAAVALAAPLLLLAAPSVGDPLHVADGKLFVGTMRQSAASAGGDTYAFGGFNVSYPEGWWFPGFVTKVGTDGSVSLAGVLPDNRTGMAAATVGKYIYLIGGLNNTEFLSEVLRYDPEDGGVVRMQARLPSPRGFSAAASDGRVIYVAGGFDESDTNFADIFRYDPAQDAVVEMDAKLPTGRSYMAGAWLGGEAVFAGGRQFTGPLPEILRYDPATDTLRVSQASLPNPRVGVAGASNGDVAFFYGGQETTTFSLQGQTVADVLRFDPVSDTLAKVDELPVARVYAAAAFDGKAVWVLGGESLVPSGHNGSELTLLRDVIRHRENLRPVATFEVSATGLAVRVNASSSTDDVGIANATWEWGDGQLPSSGLTASHIYAAAGSKTIRLTVRDGEGGRASASQDLSLENAAPLARFETIVRSLTLSVDGSGSSDPDGAVRQYAWDWGDGSQAGQGARASHTYATAGSPRVALTVTDALGARNTTARDVNVTLGNQPPTAAFTATSEGLVLTVDANASRDPEGEALDFVWNWGDGTPDGHGVRATHAYASAGRPTVVLTLTDPESAGAQSSQTVRVRLASTPPTAALTLRAEGLDVVADGTGSTAEGPLTYAWQWGDGAQTAGATTRHVYERPGTYNVTLTVTDDAGATATATRGIAVGSTAPLAPTFTLGTFGLALEVEANDPGLPPGDPGTFTWTWGDGSAGGSGASATHTYAASGTYVVTLRVADAGGRSAETSHNVSVAPEDAGGPSPPPPGGFRLPGFEGLVAVASVALAAGALRGRRRP